MPHVPDRLLLGSHSRVVFGGTSYDVATYCFEDLQIYRELVRTSQQRSFREDEAGQGLRS